MKYYIKGIHIIDLCKKKNPKYKSATKVYGFLTANNLVKEIISINDILILLDLITIIDIDLLKAIVDLNLDAFKKLNINQQCLTISIIIQEDISYIKYLKVDKTYFQSSIGKAFIKRLINIDAILLKYLPKEFISKKLWEYAFSKNVKVFKYLPTEYMTLNKLLNYKKYRKDIKDLIKKALKFEPILPLDWVNYVGNGIGVELEFITDDNLFIKLLLEEILQIKISNKIPNNKTSTGTNWLLIHDFSCSDMYELVSKKITNSKDFIIFLRIINSLQILELNKIIHINDKCGFHIHLNAKNWKYSEVKRIEKIYLNNINLINKLVAPVRKNNRYCVTKQCSTIDEEKLINTSTSLLYLDRFFVVNTKAYFYIGTVEFRHHEATTSIKEILSWLEFLNQLTKNYKKVNGNILINALFNQIHLSKVTQQFYMDKYIKNYRIV